MNKINKEDFDKARSAIIDSRGKAIALPLHTIFIDGDNMYLQNCDFECFIANTHEFIEVFNSLENLKNQSLYIREGFVDKSLNTDIFSRVDRFTFMWGDLYGHYDDFKKLADKIKEKY